MPDAELVVPDDNGRDNFSRLMNGRMARLGPASTFRPAHARQGDIEPPCRWKDVKLA